MFKLEFYDGRASLLFAAWFEGAKVLLDHFPEGGMLDNAGRVFSPEGLWVGSYYDADSGPPGELGDCCDCEACEDGFHSRCETGECSL